jgi:hypothetical protein
MDAASGEKTDMRQFENNSDLTGIIVKPLYFGLFVNILVPMVLLLLCYYLDQRGGVVNRVPGMANTLFYIFGVLSLAEAGFALWWRTKLYAQPMIRRRETFEEDFSKALLERSRPIFLVIASISVYGLIYFLLTARFNEAVFLVVFSFLVFQVVRPRYGMVRKLIAYQQKLAEQGKFLTP